MSCENIKKVMNVNKKLNFAERLAKSVRLFAHPAIDKQREDVIGIGEILHVHHHR